MFLIGAYYQERRLIFKNTAAQYPLLTRLTHDPHMLKKSHAGTDLENKKCLFQKKGMAK